VAQSERLTKACAQMSAAMSQHRFRRLRPLQRFGERRRSQMCHADDPLSQLHDIALLVIVS
jgi:hypothetical protein